MIKDSEKHEPYSKYFRQEIIKTAAKRKSPLRLCKGLNKISIKKPQ